jgi:hypothetical protein
MYETECIPEWFTNTELLTVSRDNIERTSLEVQFIAMDWQALQIAVELSTLTSSASRWGIV